MMGIQLLLRSAGTLIVHYFYCRW